MCANKTEERPLISSFVGCYDGAAWSMKMAEGVQNGKDGFVLKKVPQARSGSIVDGCAAGCHALKYKRFGIFDTDKCICASGNMNQRKETLPNGHQKGAQNGSQIATFENSWVLRYPKTLQGPDKNYMWHICCIWWIWLGDEERL